MSDPTQPPPPGPSSGPPSYDPGPQAPSYQYGPTGYQPGPGPQPAAYPPAGYPQAPQYGSGVPGYPPPSPPGMLGQPGYPTVPSGGSGKSRVGVIVAVAAVVALLLCGGAVASVVYLVRRTADTVTNLPAMKPTERPPLPTTPSSAGPDDISGAGATVPVIYEVTGEGTARINYNDRDGLKKVTNQKLPWRMEIQAPRPFSAILVVGRESTDAGKISCRLLVDGQQQATRDGTGSFAVVSCASYVPR